MGRTLRINHLLVRFSRKALICGFHRVAEPDGSMLDRRIERLAPQDFERMLNYLRSLGYSFISLSDLLESPDYSRKAVITFDDGFRSVYTQAFPILRQHKIPFTVFLTTAMVGAKRLLWLHRLYAAIDRLEPAVVLETLENCSLSVVKNGSVSQSIGNAIYQASPEALLCLTERLAGKAGLRPGDEAEIAAYLYLEAEEIREMMRHGMTVGAHGHEHWCLPSLDDKQTFAEVNSCRDFIVNNFDVIPKFYSIAYGRKNSHFDSVVRMVGFNGVCTTDAGLAGPEGESYALPRLMLGSDLLNIETSITLSHVWPGRSKRKTENLTVDKKNAAAPLYGRPNMFAEVRKGWVSVVVPTYNRGCLVIGALESIFQQTYRPIEIAVVDDGSTDNTADVVREWRVSHESEDDFAVRFIRQNNKGANAARNCGIRHAAGEFVAFLDSDDRWLPAKIEKQMKIFHSNPETGAVYCGLLYFDLTTGQVEPDSPRPYPKGWILQNMLVHDITEGTPCWIVRKKCFQHVGLFDEKLPARQDWDMFIRLSADFQIGCVPDVLVEAGNHEGERVRSDPKREILAHQIIFHKYKHLRAKFPFWVSLAARSAMYRRRGRVYFHRGISKKAALGMHLLSIMVWPFNFDSYAALAGMILPKGFRQKLHLAWNRIFGATKLAIRAH